MTKYSAVFVLLLIASICNADTWFFDKELKKEQFIFGETKITKIIDTRENPQYPLYRLEVEYKGKVEANFKNLTFSSITDFDNGNYILGVTNSGLSQFAYFILSKDGKLMTAKNHSADINYCNTSVTIVRDWVDDENLVVEEEYETVTNPSDPDSSYKYLIGAKVLDCNGEFVELL